MLVSADGLIKKTDQEIDAFRKEYMPSKDFAYAKEHLRKKYNLQEMAEAGEQVVYTGEDAGTITSAAKGVAGIDAIQDGPAQNHAQFAKWSDPSKFMKPHVRNAMLAKSLTDIGYDFKARQYWGNIASFCKDIATMKPHEMSAKHESVFESCNKDKAPFFKARGMSTISGEDGGYLVPPDIAPGLDWLQRPNTLASRVNTMTTNSPSMKFYRSKDLNRNDGTRHGGVQTYWVDEGDAGRESFPKMDFTKLDMKKLVAYIFVTPELINNSTHALEQYLQEVLQAEIDFAIANAIVWGEGTHDPLGFMNSDACIEVAKESGQTADTVVTENILNMLSRLYKEPGANPVWLHHQEMIPQLNTLEISNTPVAVDWHQGGVEQRVVQSLYGYPLEDLEFASPLGDPGDIMLVNPKGYRAITHSNVEMDISIHVAFLSDQNCFRFKFYFDGKPFLPAPVTPYQAPGATRAPATQSPFVTLAARV